MSGKESKKNRIAGRSWQLILPAEWDNINGIKAVCKNVSRNYYYILHNNDTNELGDIVKPHWHLLMTMGSSRDLPTMQNYFKDFPELLENSFEKIGSIHWAKRYLVHADDPAKYQYNINDVETNDIAYRDLFITFTSKIEEVKYLEEVLDQAGEIETFSKFRSYFTNQLASMNNSSRINTLIKLEYYWKEKQNKDSLAKQYDKTYTEINSNYETNKNNDDLPF